MVITSVIGKVSQNQYSPKRANIQPSGTKSTTVRSIVSSELFAGEFIAWKKTGNISDVTIGMKLTPMKRKPCAPIEMTSRLSVKTLSICVGISSKHSVPIAISAKPSSTASFSVRRQRS